MIICRTPLRVSFFGGGTDHPEWFNNQKSIIISSSINKYTYITLREVKKIHDYNFRLRYFKNEEVKSIKEIKHGPYREIIKKTGLQKKALELVYAADLPAMSGLGSSSSSTVGMINAATALNRKIISKKKLAKFAIDIEKNILKESVGCQDQVASAFGGFNKIIFGKNDFIVEPFNNVENIKRLNNNSILYFTGFQRIASKIEEKKIQNIKNYINFDKLKTITDITDQALKEFSKTSLSVKNIGKLLDIHWKEKRSLSKGTSNHSIDRLYKYVMSMGAYGGKLLGAGGGGFMLFLCNPKVKKKITEKLKTKNIVDFKFEFTGSQIIYNGNFSDLNN